VRPTGVAVGAESAVARIVFDQERHACTHDPLIGTARHIWAPGVAFVSDMACEHQASRGDRRRLGGMEVRLGDEVVVALHEPLAMMKTDIGNWLTTGIGHYAVFA
jgi:hypothetical protein